MKKLKEMLKEVYPKEYEMVYFKINELIKETPKSKPKSGVNEKDVMLITYGDSLKDGVNPPLVVLDKFLRKHTRGLIKNIHLLPMFPYSSDDGFSVIDYLKINKELGTWDDINNLSKQYFLMFDAVLNHISKKSEWFKGYLNEEEKYHNFFIECDPSLDYSSVVRPRALPLYYEYQTKSGVKNIWATFSEDQVDLNYENPQVLIEMLKILIEYTKKGAKFIRFDAVGFLWKKLGTTSIHLKETHLIFKIMRYVLDAVSPGTIIISETNVPHDENISYFGNGDEAHMVYQFPLPPLVMYTLLSGNSKRLTDWSKSLEKTELVNNNTYFNFLASHDGVGVRPVEDLLNDEEREILFTHTLKEGGKISYKNNEDGSKSPYELNISYLNAITNKSDSSELKVKKFLAAQIILLSLIGLPGIYIHSLLGSTNDYKGLEESNINRRINREKLNILKLEKELNDNNSIRYQIFNSYLAILEKRSEESSFSPNATQKTLNLHNNVFAVIRENKETNQSILVLVNVSNKTITLETNFNGFEIISQRKINENIVLKPYEFNWIKLQKQQ